MARNLDAPDSRRHVNRKPFVANHDYPPRVRLQIQRTLKRPHVQIFRKSDGAPEQRRAVLADFKASLLPQNLFRDGLAGTTPAAPFWERRFWLDLSFDARQLAAIRRYIRGNPVRALWKLQHPDRFVCHVNLRHRILDPAFSWSACGELTLLASPFLLAVSLARKKSLAEHEAEIAVLVDKARKGWVIVCGFLSPGEKELARRLREAPQTRWIKTMAQGLPLRYDPSLADSRELAAGRLLILSALPCGAPFDWNTCHQMNALAAAMCRRARGECEL